MQDRQIPSSTQGSLRKQPARVQGFLLQAAGLCLVALVVGSMALACSSCRPTTPGPAPVGTSHPTATARPTLVAYHPGKSLGTIVYRTTLSVGDHVYGLAWSPDSTRLGVATFSAQSWVATTGKGVVTYGLISGVNTTSMPAVVWSPDGKLVAVTGVGLGVQIHDARTGALVKTFLDTGPAAAVATSGGYLSARVTLSGGGSGAWATAWSPDGHLIATAFFGSYGQTVQVWNTSTGHLVHTYTGQAYVGSLSWSADGTSLASSDGGSIQVWNALTGQRIYDFEENTTCYATAAVAWSPDGKTLAYLNCDQVRVVNPFTGQLLRTHTGLHDTHTGLHDSSGLSALAWSPDGKSIASAGDYVEVWSVATGRTYYTFTKNASPIKCLAWSPDGKYIASANTPQPPPYTIPVTIQVWSAE